MDMKITESNTMNPYETFDYKSYEQTGENYWEQPANPPKKKKVSFNDILTNMNLVVNKQGVLQFMTPLKEDKYEPPMETYNYASPSPTYNPNMTRNEPKEPLNPNVKHSYIYNKYFKDYSVPNTDYTPQIRVPKTMEEYRHMLLDDRKKAIEQRLRIEKIKSRKLLFTCTPGAIGNDPRNIQVKNNLRKMIF